MRLRLALSYVLVSALFMALTTLGAPLLSSPQLPVVLLDLKRGLEQPDPRVAPPPEVQVTLYRPEPESLQGPLLLPEARDLERARGGATLIVGDTGLAPYQPAGQPDPAVLVVRSPVAARDPREGYLRAGGLALLVCLLVGLQLSSAVSRPLRRLIRATRAIGPEDLSQRVPEERGSGEIAELGRSFNQMAARLETSVQSLHNAEAARKQFLADVSHNLGTPLAAAQGWLQAILDGLVQDPEEQRAQLARIQRELLFVSRSVARLLELSRWEAQDSAIRRETFPLVEPLMEVVETLEEPAAQRGVRLEFKGLDSRWQVEGDRGRLRDLIQILLENAVLHSGADVIQLVTREEEGRVQVEVKDNGKGIASVDMSQIRQGFRRASGRSVGLGLAIADRLVQAHGGRLEIESQPGQGTCVRFSLPLSASSVGNQEAAS